LNSGVFQLHVTYNDGHNAAIDGVIDIVSLVCPFLDTLHMVEHHPCVLKITTWLHPFHQVYTAAKTYLKHLEYKYLIKIRALAWEYACLDIRPVVATSEHGNAIHDLKSPYVPE
jgi:hypothetical protein